MAATLVETAFLVGFPVLFAALGAALLYDVLRVRRTGIRVPGVVGGRNVRPGNGATTLASARFTFRTTEGQRVTARQRIYVSTNLMREGQRVTVAYDPRRPHRAEIIEARSQILGAALFIAVGAVVGAVFSVVNL
ncbi:DUF3592 domain-containing protein [Nocardiopsis coralliicola]